MTPQPPLAPADTQHQAEPLGRLAQRLGTALTDAFGQGAAPDRTLDGVLGRIGRTLADAASKPARALPKIGTGSLFGGLVPSGADAAVTPFAQGGVVAAPSYFPSGESLLRGEPGAAADPPLARAQDDHPGTRFAGGGASGRPVNVTVTIAAPTDADGFRRSEAQVAAALARAVARGQRGL